MYDDMTLPDVRFICEALRASSRAERMMDFLTATELAELNLGQMRNDVRISGMR